MWIRLDIIQIKFEFRHTWLTFSGVIALCWNLVFQVFLFRLLRYWLEMWYMYLSWHNTDQVWVSLCLTYFYRSYCPLLKFSFLDFSLLSFEIWTWNLWYMNLSWHNTDQRFTSRLTYFYRSYCPLQKFSFTEFGTWICHVIMQIKFGFVMLGLLLQELLAFAKIQFWDIELKFGVWIYFGLTRSSLSFVKLDLLLQELLPFAKIYFKTFPCSLLRFSLKTDQVSVYLFL